MTAAAVATSHLRIGSGICLVVERDPIITAKEVASIDHLSGGRVEFGVGAGWNREEMANHGTDPRRRIGLMRERVEAMKEIWTPEEASYSGEHVAFDRIWSWPKPAQRPHPPVLVGGNGPKVLDRVLAFGDAWLPNHRARRRSAADPRAACAGRGGGAGDPGPIVGVPADAAVLEQYERGRRAAGDPLAPVGRPRARSSARSITSRPLSPSCTARDGVAGARVVRLGACGAARHR